MTDLSVRRLGPESREDFLRLHDGEHGLGWCRCVAFWMASWDGWAERSREENLALREGLFERGTYDGYLGYEGETPVAWCQVGKRNSFPMLRQEECTDEERETWAITCFAVQPEARRRGVATELLRRVIEDLRVRGAQRVEMFPRRSADLSAQDLWNGSEGMARAAGFRFVQNVGPRSLYLLELGVQPAGDSG